jgi:transcription termination/antitermination protein NusA
VHCQPRRFSRSAACAWTLVGFVEREKKCAQYLALGFGLAGACIGPMGQRVRAVMSELHGEKIDIIDWSEDPGEFVGNALSPAKALRVAVVDAATRTAQVTVPDYQLSLAIGREGQNARLAARLTGWRIDIRSDAEPDRQAAGGDPSSGDPVRGESASGAAAGGASPGVGAPI